MIKDYLDMIKEMKASNEPFDVFLLNAIAMCIGFIIIILGIFIIASPMTLALGLSITAAAILIGRVVIFLVNRLS